MDEAHIEISSRLSLHEFLLEQLFANGALKHPAPLPNWAAFSSDLLRLCRDKSYPAPTDPEMEAIARRINELAGHFCEKVRIRIEQES